MEGVNKTILVVASDQETVSFLTKHIVKKYDLITTSSGKVGLQRFSQIKNIDFVFLEYELTDSENLNLLHGIRSINMNVPIVFTSGESITGFDSEAVECGIIGCLNKPFEEEDLEKLFILCHSAPHMQKRDVQNAVDFIEEHIMERITAKRIARACNLSYRQLARKFKKALGMNIMEYVKRRRVQKSKGLLRGKAMWIDDIAAVLGFADVRAFRTAFKDLTGMTPKQYQMRMYNPNPKNISSQRQLPFSL